MSETTVRRSESIAALAAAMQQAQAELKNPPKDSVNPHFKSRYADLATVRDAVLPVLNRHGLAIMHLPCDSGGEPALTTLLTHTSGEWVETTMQTRPLKKDPQSVGSALTYARRYTLQAVAGVAADDDDDATAASRPARRAPAAARTTEPPAYAGPPAGSAAVEAEGEDPAVTDRAACVRLFKATGTTWEDAMTWLTAHVAGADYTAETKYHRVALEHRRALVAELRKKPGGGDA